MTEEKQPIWPRGSTPWGNTAEVAVYLRVNPSTLSRLRGTGEGPPWVAVTAGTPRYHIDDVDEWLRSRKAR
ncbi:MAG: helix-turn-helix domain-containing protein [Propionibacteriaceae bacterium]|nr:helix-turn-helix domain-containing protein [Propionibacteriaceae bacterium]